MSIIHFLIGNDAVTQSIKAFMRGLGHTFHNIPGSMWWKIILLNKNLGKSFNMLTSKSDILSWIQGVIEHSDSLLDADTNLEGVRRQLIHGNFDGGSTASLVFGQCSEVVGHILTDCMMESLEHKLQDNAVGQLIRWGVG